MISNKKRIRVDYAPLNLAVSVECLTPTRPALQTYNGRVSPAEYEPDRRATGSEFWPQVFASASDGSWHHQYANNLLTEMHWYVDDIEISQHPDFQGNNDLGNPKYSIDTSSSNYRGAITIRVNVPPEKQYSLRFEGVVADTRLGTLNPVKTDPFILSTEDVSEDAYSISIGDDQIIQYNPFKDKLHLYEYKVAHGIISASAASEAAATDENAYKRAIAVTVNRGPDVITTGFTLKLYRVNNVSSFTELTTADPEVLALSNTGFTLDLRLITKADYLVRAVLTDSTRPNPQIQFSVNRVYPNYNLEPTNGAAIMPSDIQRYDEVMAHADGNVVECPGSIIKMNWFTDTVEKTRMAHHEGEKTLFLIQTTGIGKTYEDDWMDVYVEGEIKPAYEVATDGTDPFVDESGNILIIN